MAGKVPPEQTENMENNIGVFEEAVARAERLGKAAREAAGSITSRSPTMTTITRDSVIRLIMEIMPPWKKFQISDVTFLNNSAVFRCR